MLPKNVFVSVLNIVCVREKKREKKERKKRMNERKRVQNGNKNILIASLKHFLFLAAKDETTKQQLLKDKKRDKEKEEGTRERERKKKRTKKKRKKEKSLIENILFLSPSCKTAVKHFFQLKNECELN